MSEAIHSDKEFPISMTKLPEPVAIIKADNA